MIVRTGNAPHQRIDHGAAPGRRYASPGIAETFGYEPIPGRLVRPEPEPEPNASTLRVRAFRERHNGRVA